jgi:HEAT repeat protein
MSVRLETAKALGRIGGPGATEGLLKALRDNEYQVRIHALRSIEDHRDAALMSTLIEMAEDREGVSRSRYEKQELYCTVARVGGEQAIPFLAKALDRGSWLTRGKHEARRVCAASALGFIRTPQARRILEKHLKSSSGSLKEACQLAIRKLTEEEEPPAEESR